VGLQRSVPEQIKEMAAMTEPATTGAPLTPAEPAYETRVLGKVGDWLVIPVLPPTQHLYRWGKITEVLAGDGPVRYRVRWIGADQDSVVLPPEFSRIESAQDWQQPAGDAIGRWPS
jgi:hypothetical protein